MLTSAPDSRPVSREAVQAPVGDVVRAVLPLCLLVAVASGLLLAWHDVPARVASLYPLDVPAGAMTRASDVLLLYAALPSLIVAACVLFLAPGVFTVLAAGGDPSSGAFVLKGFGASFAILVLVDSVAKVLVPVPLGPVPFILMLIALALASCGVWMWQMGRNVAAPYPSVDAPALRRLAWMAVIAYGTTVLLLPWIFWQDLNADGVEALEIGRSLGTHLIPRFANITGFMGLGIGLVSMAYPIHWFVAVFGPLEAATRLPLALYLPVLFVGLLALIEVGNLRRLRIGEEAAIVLALGSITVALGFNASYDSYFADLSSPAAYEMLTVLAFAGSVFFLLTGERRWFLLFTTLGFFARPTGLLILLLAAPVAVLAAPSRLRTVAVDLGLALGLLVLTFLAYEKVFIPVAGGGADPGYPSQSVLERFQYLTVVDWRRFVWVAAPAGFLPFASLVLARRREPMAFTLALICAGYFLVFLFPSFTNLHHFVPIMVLPIAVYWRLVVARQWRSWAALAATAGAGAALWFGLPQDLSVNRTMRLLGHATDYRIGCYGCQGDERGHRLAITHKELLFNFFKAEWDVADPAREQVGGQHQLYYATPPKPANAIVNYLVQPVSVTAPAGFVMVGQDDQAAAYVRDVERWKRDRYGMFDVNYRSPLYTIERATLFPFEGVRQRRYTINLGSAPFLWRYF